MDADIKVAQIIFVWYSTDPGHSVKSSIWATGLKLESAYGSAIKRSVSLMILLGSAMVGCFCAIYRGEDCISKGL